MNSVISLFSIRKVRFKGITDSMRVSMSWPSGRIVSRSAGDTLNGAISGVVYKVMLTSFTCHESNVWLKMPLGAWCSQSGSPSRAWKQKLKRIIDSIHWKMCCCKRAYFWGGCKQLQLINNGFTSMTVCWVVCIWMLPPSALFVERWLNCTYLASLSAACDVKCRHTPMLMLSVASLTVIFRTNAGLLSNTVTVFAAWSC